jgi:hypothetical protein
MTFYVNGIKFEGIPEFDICLHSPVFREYFIEYCATEYCSENYNFVMEAQKILQKAEILFKDCKETGM